ncbi:MULTISPECIES: hypothetical protein [Xanthomonas]|uniref:Uncharacterized protein n=2 Tax=Xanthomonas TaxID=338 RepID=A0A7Z7IYI5_XANCH|nr:MULTISPECIES: hypothetical protein [Xanthomonas]ATS39240.1 hypothetical protein XcfCFBP6988P_14855 [Xanthomonas citri pv. phaseoli var. fuscans]ATS41954.1 hypothetical protein XcfCFBP6989P_05640 [Xanthomonas citri pv. phaseoli var. fuscans]ATS47243.1 hypothetical protein XcfCFBP6990P_11725 [Xanthomonas citri pv. phaseoli var. fuscans]ATS86379.1 hypothetical protein XcfCFBP6991P_22510 [Xanthomonas citri pv. phaseoli var. fuscans]QWN20885.1 hypothetical protein DGM98_12790 [Xanthomonas citri]
MVFPSNPTNGQAWTEYGRSWVYDGVGWGAVVSALPGGSVLPVRTVSQLTDAAADINRQFRCIDAPGGEAIIYSDGTTYLRQSDQSPVVT